MALGRVEVVLLLSSDIVWNLISCFRFRIHFLWTRVGAMDSGSGVNQLCDIIIYELGSEPNNFFFHTILSLFEYEERLTKFRDTNIEEVP